MKLFFYLLTFTFLIQSCGSTEDPNLKNVKPVTLEFFETYAAPEIQVQWFAAAEWLNQNDSLQLENKNLNQLAKLAGDFCFSTVNKENIESVSAILALPGFKQFFPEKLEFMWSAKPELGSNGSQVFLLYAIKVPEGGKARIHGKHIKSAARGLNTQSGSNTVNLTFKDRRIDDWERMTRDNIGRFIAITVDRKVFSCPRVNDKISGGNTEISGAFTVEEADELAAGINAGR